MASVLSLATSQIPSIKGEDGFIRTEQFLAVCRLILPVVDKLGTAFILVRSDINGNIQRLADRAAKDPVNLHRLFALVQDDLVRGTQGDSSSVTKGLLWLKRALEFTLLILKRVGEDPSAQLFKTVKDTYMETLLQFHGFVASSAFYLAFNFLPTREAFIANLGVTPGANVEQELEAFVTAFSPIVVEIHKFLADNSLDDPTKV